MQWTYIYILSVQSLSCNGVSSSLSSHLRFTKPSSPLYNTTSYTAPAASAPKIGASTPAHTIRDTEEVDKEHIE